MEILIALVSIAIMVGLGYLIHGLIDSTGQGLATLIARPFNRQVARIGQQIYAFTTPADRQSVSNAVLSQFNSSRIQDGLPEARVASATNTAIEFIVGNSVNPRFFGARLTFLSETPCRGTFQFTDVPARDFDVYASDARNLRDRTSKAILGTDPSATFSSQEAAV